MLRAETAYAACSANQRTAIEAHSLPHSSPLLVFVSSPRVWTAAMPQCYCPVTHSALHPHFRPANVIEKKQMCGLIHPGTPASQCMIFMMTLEEALCDADRVRGPVMCHRFEAERKTKEKNLVLVEDKDFSEARTVAAAEHSYKLTTAVAIAKGVLPEGVVAAIVRHGSVARNLNAG
jgi:hypothetical protein